MKVVILPMLLFWVKNGQTQMLG